MTLSRTARILIALLLLAAAAFFWFNFFSQKPVIPPILGGNQASDISTAPTVAPTTPGVLSTSVPETDTNTGTAGGATTSAPTTVAVPGAPQVATRDVQVSALPFLVTEPPPATPLDATAQATTAGATRPGSEQRATVNPFSPILVQAQAAGAPSGESQASANQIVTASGDVIIDNGAVPSPRAVAAAPEPVKAPAPRALAPASSHTAALPRALPAGTLPVTPGILRSVRTAPIAAAPEPVTAPTPRALAPASSQTAALPSALPADALPVTPGILNVRTAPVAAAPDDLGRLVAVREPDEEAVNAGTLARVGGGPTELDSATALHPLGPSAEHAIETATDQPPLVVGADALSRYLRDNNVRFTGAVLGPVNVGVFRSAAYTVPVVLALGQSLPDTGIVLTDIRGHEARFSQDTKTQTLSLDLRR